MELRHECKRSITPDERSVLRNQLCMLCRPDPYAIDGRYLIRTLYFDRLEDNAPRKKTNGISIREKFRIRYYNGDTSFICLEKKSKFDTLSAKEQAPLTEAETRSIIRGDTEWMQNADRTLVQELYAKMIVRGLGPRSFVEFTREPFVYGNDTVRVTFDYDNCTGLKTEDFLNPDSATDPVMDDLIIMEVKWAGTLPSSIQDIVQLEGRRTARHSTYTERRMYG